MPTTLRVLGQVSPPANTENTLYTTPGLTSTVISSVVICNTNVSNVTARLSVSASGGATATPDYFVYDTTVNANETLSFQLGLTLQAGAVIRCRASNTGVNFHAYGQENS